MFQKSKSARKAGSVQFDTLVSNKTSVKGDIHFSGGLHVDGKIEGTVYAEEGSDAVLRISDIGEIEGDVYAPHIIINGTVYGNVYSSEDLELASKAAIHGNVYYHLIEMAMGAAVNGSLLHRKEGNVPAGARTLPSQSRRSEQLEDTGSSAEGGDDGDAGDSVAHGEDDASFEKV
ncbi:cytoskeletal protein CcmA (bactofilin family) [Halospina denitrificans]|uniref:Cytoskeletal protein CcmA (Bactofilin family) n=1 Tax=Halospina denitrificans TaxID=332522 RepID=A0A4R7K200_9GAMM|nr:polymer-forming cytoskeletal protein [Halospina denitrificans]TDT44615.1 cytoskeletal protein CcmA (bactofilin family) [Halospina denitrificans]